MSLRRSEFAQVADELEAGLRGALVQKLWATSEGLAFLELRRPSRSTLICLCAQPGLARISVASAHRHNDGTPPPFQRVLRTRLVGAHLLDVRPTGSGVALRFQKGPVRLSLRVEVSFGGVLALEDETGKVLATSNQRPLRRAERSPSSSEGELPSRLDALATAPTDAEPFPHAAAAERLLSEQGERRTTEVLRRQLTASAKRKRVRLRRTLEKVRSEAARRPAAEAHRRAGELLSRNLHRIQRGAARVRVTEYTEAGPKEVELELDPSRSPRAQVDWHFHQHRRLLRGCEKAAERVALLEREEADAERELEAITRMDEAALERAVAASARPGGGALGRAERASAKRGAPPVHQPFKTYRTAEGAPIWVGRGGAQNDELTFHRAKPSDLWLHARGVTGAHVVVPLARGAEIPQELLLDAAHLALHHSSARGEPKGEVSYTLAKYVRKMRGGAPGQVTYTNERTFWLRLEPSRLERLLASRLRE